MKMIFLIFLAGAAGTLCRYGIMQLPLGDKFPYTTLIVNLTGSFLVGMSYVLLKTYFQEYAQYFPVLFIGFFGAFTTFSTFMLDVAKYFETGHCGMGFLFFFIQNAAGLFCIWCGMLAGKHWG